MSDINFETREILLKAYKPFLDELCDALITNIAEVKVDYNSDRYSDKYFIAYKGHEIFHMDSSSEIDYCYWTNKEPDVNFKIDSTGYPDLLEKVNKILTGIKKYEHDMNVAKFNNSIKGFVKKFSDLRLKMPKMQEGELSLYQEEGEN